MSTRRIPFPCAVYTRDRHDLPYVFSHFCELSTLKTFPRSLRVRDLTRHCPAPNWNSLRGACFVVLVAGDRAQCVSLSNLLERRTHFLYPGSPYSRPWVVGARKRMEELEPDYVSLHFSSTMACYCEERAELTDVVPFESGIVVMPRELRERDLPKIAEWVERQIRRAMVASVWLTKRGAYNEHTLALRQAPTVPDAQPAPERMRAAKSV